MDAPVQDFTQLSFREMPVEFRAIASDAQAVFEQLSESQLNWKSSPSTWSVAQCFDHVLSLNSQLVQSIERAANSSNPKTIWQRLPFLPGIVGPILIRSQSPQAVRKFKAPPNAVPSSSSIDPRIIERFVAHQRELAGRVRSLEERRLGSVVISSPFASIITYTVLDACRLLAAHQRRHFEQARRVTQEPGFPSIAVS